MTTEAAFIAYVAARRPRLFRTACLLCGDPHRAEDVVQDALVRLYAAWDRVARTDNIDGYVRRIIVNADYSDRRRPWRRERAAESRDVPLDPGFPAEDAEAIRAALRALPPGQRRVIVLRHIWNLTIEETAEELDVLNRLVDYHDHIAPPMVPVTDDVRRGRRRVRRNRGIATGAMALGLAGVVLAASVITAGDRDARPAPASPSPPPSPTTTKSQSPLTWADTSVAAQEGYGWKILDPLKTARDAWFPVVAEHLDPTGDHLQRLESSAFGVEFERPAEGSDYAADTASTSAYSTSGRIGLIVDSGQLNPLNGCRYLMDGPAPSNGTESCSGEQFVGPDGERAKIARWGRRCGAYEGGGPAPATCGDYRVEVAVERRDGLIGYVRVEGRGTPDFNPFARAAMAAAAADPRITLPESAFAVPSDRTVESVLVDHFPDYRAGSHDSSATGHPGYGQAGGKLGPLGLFVQVWPAGGPPTCGRTWLTECVERRVYGVDDPTTVFVGAWDEEDWADCCPKNSRATSRVLVYVGPRHTVVVSEGLVVRADEEPVGADLDQRLIDLALDPRLQ